VLLAAGGLALLLSAIGLYGVIAFLVTRRTREIGVRIALGARPGAVLRFVLGRMAGLIAAGLAAGVVLSLAAGQALRSVIYGVSPGDPRLMALVLVALVSAAGLACWRPARRAVAIDPVNALRCE
jgi:putative ABC transport system permease protein